MMDTRAATNLSLRLKFVALLPHLDMMSPIVPISWAAGPWHCRTSAAQAAA